MQRGSPESKKLDEARPRVATRTRRWASMPQTDSPALGADRRNGGPSMYSNSLAGRDGRDLCRVLARRSRLPAGWPSTRSLAQHGEHAVELARVRRLTPTSGPAACRTGSRSSWPSARWGSSRSICDSAAPANRSRSANRTAERASRAETVGVGAAAKTSLSRRGTSVHAWRPTSRPPSQRSGRLRRRGQATDRRAGGALGLIEALGGCVALTGRGGLRASGLRFGPDLVALAGGGGLLSRRAAIRLRLRHEWSPRFVWVAGNRCYPDRRVRIG